MKRLSVVLLTFGAFFAATGSAYAAAGGTNRPVKVTFSNTSVANLATNTLHYEGTLLMSHLGKSTFQGEGSFFFTGFNTFDQNDSFVITTPNGDKLFGTDANKGEGFPEGGLLAGNTQTMVQAITGGTGRFENATGTLTGMFTSVVTSFTEFVTYSVHGTSEGTISY